MRNFDWRGIDLADFWQQRRMPILMVSALVFTGAVIGWAIAPSQAELTAEGQDLFVHEWQPHDPLSGGGDGLGPVFNDRSCVACHFQGGVGGAGTNEHNVSTFEILPNRHSSEHSSGVIHASATAEHFLETSDQRRQLTPIIPASTKLVGSCFEQFTAFDPLVSHSINTPALFGVGLIDEISMASLNWFHRKKSLNQMSDEFQLDFETTPTGRPNRTGFGKIGKFGWKGQFATLEEFVATACAVELGLTNSVRAQDMPGTSKPDPNAKYDMTNRQLQSLVEFCRSLPRPEQQLPTDTTELAQVRSGEDTFATIGCADCHVPDIGGVEGIYTDFMLHRIERPDAPGYREEFEVPLPNSSIKPDEWQTPPLWGVADSAPYFHDGGSETLEAAIVRHHGQAKHVTERYRRLSQTDKDNLIRFLNTLRAPTTALPVSHVNNSQTRSAPGSDSGEMHTNSVDL